MKGIKECLNWLMDNPMKLLESEKGDGIRFNNKNVVFQFYSQGECKWFALDGDDFDALNTNEWYESFPTVDFLAAYEDCKRTGNRYKGCENTQDVIYKNPVGEVIVYKTPKPLYENIKLNQLWIRTRS